VGVPTERVKLEVGPEVCEAECEDVQYQEGHEEDEEDGCARLEPERPGH